MKKKLFVILLIILTMGVMSACGSSGSEEQGEAESQPESAAEESADAVATDSGDTMVIYFSVTGNTEGVAETIAQITGADMYKIEAAEPYTDADIDYNNDSSRASVEQDDPTARPAFAGEVPSLEGVNTVYLGYPIWFGQEPRIMDTFVETVDFDGVTVIPFCTSGSSDIGDSGKTLEQNAGSGTWLEGQRFDAGASEDELRAWIESLQ
jgi:flavodoxin